MDLDQLKQILELVEAHGLAELEIEHEGMRLKVRTSANGAAPAAGPAVPAAEAAPPISPLPPKASEAAAVEAAETEIELAIVKSPIVGTFYRSAEPGAAPFVEIGSQVKKGQALCIIEAMKLMNEIDSECDGEVVNIYVENGQPVQYGERLFALKAR